MTDPKSSPLAEPGEVVPPPPATAAGTETVSPPAPPPPPDPPPPTVPAQVSLEELTAERAPEGATEVITGLQRVGFKLASYVLTLISLTTLLIIYLAFWRTDVPAPPGRLYYFDAGSLARYERAVALYVQAAGVPVQHAQMLFKDIVVTAFLPAFTGILGYIFGSRENSARR